MTPDEVRHRLLDGGEVGDPREGLHQSDPAPGRLPEWACTRTFLAPDIFPVEVANAFYNAGLQGRLPAGQFANRLADVLKVGPVLYKSTSLLPRAIAIIGKAVARIGIYDCLYVALAEREGCELITSDRRLIYALQKDFPFITDLATLP